MVTLIQPPSLLCPIALSSTLSTIRHSSAWLPVTQVPSWPVAWCTVRCLAAIAPARTAKAAAVRYSSESVVWPGRSPCCARASARNPSSSPSTRSSSPRSRSARAIVAAGTGSGLATATSTLARIVASGVRSSCEALATNRRCAAKAPSSRSSSPSMVSARSFSSSPGPATASRSCRLSAEIRRVATVIRRSGRSTRPATIQPTTSDTTVMMPSAIADPTSRSCETPEWILDSAVASWS